MDLASFEPAPAEVRGAPAARSRTARGLAVAVAGLFAGHWLVYRILAPNALQRALLLAETGHAYLPPAVTVGAGVAALAAATTFVAGVRRGSRGPGGNANRHHSLVQTILLPAIAQAVAFCLLEALERVLAGAPLNGLLGPLLPIGVGLQLAVGALGGLLLFGLERAGERAGYSLAGRLPVLRRTDSSTALPTRTARPARPPCAEAFGIRGPPEGAASRA